MWHAKWARDDSQMDEFKSPERVPKLPSQLTCLYSEVYTVPGALDSVNQTTPDDASDTQPTIQMMIESIMCGLDKINHL